MRSSPVLLRGIGRYDFIALIINITIGSGILRLPAKLYALAVTWSVLAYGVRPVLSRLLSFVLPK